MHEKWGRVAVQTHRHGGDFVLGEMAFVVSPIDVNLTFGNLLAMPLVKSLFVLRRLRRLSKLSDFFLDANSSFQRSELEENLFAGYVSTAFEIALVI